MEDGVVGDDEEQYAVEDGDVGDDEEQDAVEDGDGGDDEEQDAVEDGDVGDDEEQDPEEDGEVEDAESSPDTKVDKEWQKDLDHYACNVAYLLYYSHVSSPTNKSQQISSFLVGRFDFGFRFNRP